jgi:long-subunit acyl-CoA synthetase (AMP-forming)
MLSAPSEIAHQINDSGSTIVFVQPELLPVFNKARAQIKRPFADTHVILLAKPAARPLPQRYRLVSDLFKGQKRATRATFNGSEAQATAWLCYSSGTTGLPKGVMTSHHNMTSQIQAVNCAIDVVKPLEDVVLGILPFSHIFGLTILLLQPFTFGCPVVVLPRFEEVSVLSAIQRVSCGRVDGSNLSVQGHIWMRRPSYHHCSPPLEHCRQV